MHPALPIGLSALRPGWCVAALLASLGGAGLVFTNPGPDQFETFASDQLVDVIEAEVCRGSVLPSLVRLALRDCPRLIQAQRRAIGAQVGRHTLRRNFGVMSVYRTEFGGAALMGWALPRFTATVVGGAGQLVIVQAGLNEEQP
jgi:hypothetical protein